MKNLSIITTLLGLIIMNTVAANCTVIDFEDINTDTAVNGLNTISPLLSIYGNSDMYVVEEGQPTGTKGAYDSEGGRNWLPGDNKKSFGNSGVLGETIEDLKIVFNEDTVVGSFSIDIADYGDYFPAPYGGTGPRSVTLTAYGYNDSVLNVDTWSVGADANPSNLYYDVFNFGLKTLSVEGYDIAYVELTFSGNDPGVSFDNLTICTLIQNLVGIDVKPGSYPNSFNINGKGVIPVAILGSADFDVTTIDVNTLSLGGLEVAIRGKSKLMVSYEDVNGDYSLSPQGAPDGFLDLVIHFEDDPSFWDAGDDIVYLKGNLLDGSRLLGVDTINVVKVVE